VRCAKVSPVLCAVLMISVGVIGNAYAESDILDAAEAGELEELVRLLDGGEDIETKNDARQTPLILAAANNRVDVIRELVRRGANLEATEKESLHTPLLAAIRERHIEATRVLVEAGAGLSAEADNGANALDMADLTDQDEISEFLEESGAKHGTMFVEWAADKDPERLAAAITIGSLRFTRWLISNGADVQAPTSTNGSPLSEASYYGHPHIAEYLIEQGADLDFGNDLGFTPVHEAAANNRVEVARVLIAAGADVTIPNDRRNTPLHAAAQRGFVEIGEMLLDAGAEINAQNETGHTPLWAAIQDNFVPFARMLLRRGANVGMSTKMGSTILHCIAQEGRGELLADVLEKGAVVDAASSVGLTPLGSASYNGHSEVVRELLSAGADPNHRTNDDLTPLHLTAIEGYSDPALLLLAAGADPCAVQELGFTALDIAIDSGKSDYVRAVAKEFEECSIWSSVEVERAQRALLEIGYDPGSADGQWGGKTETALQAFQADIGIPIVSWLGPSIMGFLDRAAKEGIRAGKWARVSGPSRNEDLSWLSGSWSVTHSPSGDPGSIPQEGAFWTWDVHVAGDQMKIGGREISNVEISNGYVAFEVGGYDYVLEKRSEDCLLGTREAVNTISGGIMLGARWGSVSMKKGAAGCSDSRELSRPLSRSVLEQ